MNTTQLECFLAVAETLNFSKAASMVNISQPAVSHQISSLEAELGVRLFLRTNKSVQLTKEGLSFIGDAETIVRTAAESIHRLSANVKEKKQILAIGVHNQFELDVTVPVMSIMGKKYPNFEPEITMMPFKSLDNLLEENKVQLIFGLKSEDETPKAECFTTLIECPVMLICSKDDVLAKNQSVNINDINGRRVVLIKRHKCPDAAVDGYMKLGMPNSNNVLLADGCEAAFAMAKAGLGVTAFPITPYMQDDDVAYIKIEGVAPISMGIYSKNLLKANRLMSLYLKQRNFIKIIRILLTKHKAYDKLYTVS